MQSKILNRIPQVNFKDNSEHLLSQESEEANLIQLYREIKKFFESSPSRLPLEMGDELSCNLDKLCSAAVNYWRRESPADILILS